MWRNDLTECAPVERGQQRVQLPLKDPCEGVDVGLGLCVEGGDLSSFIVEVDAHILRHEANWQRCLRLGAGVEMLRAAPQDPVALPGLMGTWP